MANAERGGQTQPEEGNITRGQFLRKMAPGTIVALAGLGGYSYENMKKTPPSPTRIGELIVALAGIGWNIRTLLKMEHQEPQNPPQK